MFLEMIYPSVIDNSQNLSLLDASGAGLGEPSVALSNDQLVHDILITTTTTEMPLLATVAAPAATVTHPTPMAGINSSSQAFNDLPCFKDLIAVLVECFTIISLGYLSGRFKLISTDAKDLGVYLSTFALPMVIFLNIARMEFNTLNMSFLFCMLISKLMLFILVTLTTLVISYPANFSFAGALSILATQSNDFALGYPLIKSIYGQTRPEMLSYLNLMGPIQLLIINPLGIVMLEYGKSKSARQLRENNSNQNNGTPKECLYCSSSSSSPRSGKYPPAHRGERQQVIKTSTSTNYDNQHQIISHSSLNGSQQWPNRQQQTSIPQVRSATTLINNCGSSEGNLGADNGRRELAAVVEKENVGAGKWNVTDDQDDDDHLIVTGAHLFKGHHQQRAQQRQQLEQKAPIDPTVRRKNIKSLSLIITAAVVPTRRSFSEHSHGSIGVHYDELNQTMMSSSGKPAGSQQVVPRSHSNSPISQSAPAAAVADNVATLNNRQRVPGANDKCNVYTRPKLFGFIANSKWLRSRSTTEQSGQRSPQATRDPRSSRDTQMHSVLTGELDGRHSCTCPTNSSPARQSQPDLGFIIALLTNPLIIASVVALAVNLIHGPELPKFVTKVSNSIAASFAAPALFVVGLSMYGKFNLVMKNPNDFLLSSVLVTMKVLVLPSIMRTIVTLILPHYTSKQEVVHLSDFSYLYGLLPTAPGACIIAKQYEVLTNVVSITMLLSTFISAPLMLATSAVISQASSIEPETVLKMIEQTLRASSSITLVASLMTIYLLWKASKRVNYLTFINSIDRLLESAKRAKATHLFTCLLVLTQLVVAIAGLSWTFVDIGKPKSAYDIGGATESLETEHFSAHDDDEELLADEERHSLHNRILTPGPHGFFVPQQAGSNAHEPMGLGFLCTIQYILSSGGLLIARFIILCIVLTNFARRFQAHRFEPLIHWLIMKVFPIVGLAIIVSLAFESQYLACSPSEASLPTWPVSIYIRLVFNTILLCSTVPLLALTFRLENRAAWFKSQAAADEHAGSTLTFGKRRHFVQSNGSLSSETSSAITTSTNLDNPFGSTQHQQQGTNSVRVSSVTRPPLEQVICGATNRSYGDGTMGATSDRGNPDQRYRADCDKEQAQQRRIVKQEMRESQPYFNADDPQCDQIGLDMSGAPSRTNGSPLSQLNGATRPKGAHASQDDRHQSYCIEAPCVADLNQNYLIQGNEEGEGEESKSVNVYYDLAASHLGAHENEPELPQDPIDQHYEGQQAWPPSAQICPKGSESDKHSILIVFVLFQAILNVTSMIQQLSQDKSSGTFTLVEMANVALDFGQGLVTFLVIGLQAIPVRDSSSRTDAHQARARDHSRTIV